MQSSPLVVALLGCVAAGVFGLGACGGAEPSDLLTAQDPGKDASTSSGGDSGHGNGSKDAGKGGSSSGSGDDANAACGPQTCLNGCCDGNGQCVAGLDDMACGGGGQGVSCQDCTLAGGTCAGGTCTGSSSSSSSSSGGSCDPSTCAQCLGAMACCASGKCGCTFAGACLAF